MNATQRTILELLTEDASLSYVRLEELPLTSSEDDAVAPKPEDVSSALTELARLAANVQPDVAIGQMSGAPLAVTGLTLVEPQLPRWRSKAASSERQHALRLRYAVLPLLVRA